MMEDLSKKNPRIKFIQRINSKRNMHSKIQSKSPKAVKFIDKKVDDSQQRKKHRSASILKKRDKVSLEKTTNQRSSSVNSMASQGPLDDQSCQNSYYNKSIKEQYLNLLQLAKKKGKFIDDFFPPIMSSLFSYASRKINKHPNIKWMRIPQIFPNRLLALTNPHDSKINIKPSTNLSVQFFSLGLNTIKNNKIILKKMFEDQKVNQFGIYYVKIFQSNVWKYMIVDDNIPVLQVEGSQHVQPVFITCESSEQEQLQIWPFILQKALAKQYSNYQALQSGNIFDFLEEIVNKTCDQYDLQHKKQDISQLFNTPDCIGFGQTKQLIKLPLHIGFGNSNKISFNLPNKQKIITQPLQLHNYFSKIYLLGNKTFNYICQCPVKQAKQSVSIRHFTLKNPSCCSITLNQKDKKFFQQSLKYSYVWIRMIIVQKQYNGSCRWIDGRYDNQKTMSIQADLPAGDYYIIIMPEWIQKSYDLTLILRCKFPIRIQRKLYQQGMIQQACADLAQRYGRLNQLNSYICSYNCIHEDMGLIIQNINNQRIKGQVKIVRSIDGLKSKVQIQAVNKQFLKNKSIEVLIKHNRHYTVVLKMKGGIDRQFFKTFDFGCQ